MIFLFILTMGNSYYNVRYISHSEERVSKSVF